MAGISYKRHRFPPDVIRYAVWLYFRFTLSLRDVEEMLAERGIEASYETVRCWALKFGQSFAQNLRRRRPTASGRWHLDEMVVKIGGKRMWLWRAVDDEGLPTVELEVEGEYLGTCFRVPHLSRLVKASGEHPRPVSVERRCGHVASVPLEGES